MLNIQSARKKCHYEGSMAWNSLSFLHKLLAPLGSCLNLPPTTFVFVFRIFQLHCKFEAELGSAITSLHHCLHLCRSEREREMYVYMQNVSLAIKFKSFRGREQDNRGREREQQMYGIFLSSCTVFFVVRSLAGTNFVRRVRSHHSNNEHIFYLFRVNNDAVIIEDSLFCGFDILQIHATTAVVDEDRAIPS
jgi:hypothetical protein